MRRGVMPVATTSASYSSVRPSLEGDGVAGDVERLWPHAGEDLGVHRRDAAVRR